MAAVPHAAVGRSAPLLTPTTRRASGRPRHGAKLTRQSLRVAASSGEGAGKGGTPGFQTLVETPRYSIRLYDTHYVVRTAYQRRDEGFDALGSYLDGDNEAGARIPAPQPVIMTYPPGGAKSMQLFVPTPKEGQPPLPLQAGVSLAVAGGEALATTEFTGYATKEAADKAKRELIAALEADGFPVSGAEGGVFMIAQYGPLFSLSTRVNELLIPIKL